MKSINKNLYILAGMFFLFSNLSFLNAAGVNRYAIYVGSNKGGDGRSELLYAGTDAENIKNTMAEVGGISDKNSILLVNPSEKEINSAMQSITKMIIQNADSSRSEFLFYYSGHSDEDSLLLGNQKFSYSALKNAISEIPSDIHVVILDSCYSGNFIRTKGGQKKKPFLVDDSSVVKGHAYLSSSSETEFSQESDEIEASYFTNAVVTGLRGAADASGDKKVTLNELYSYAFNETLKKTEDSKSGPQHPNYNITLVGSGDLILSDFSESDSIVSVGKDVIGKVVLRDSNGKLVSEIDKSDSVPVMLALPEGKYKVVVIGEEATLQGDVEIKKDDAFVIEKNQLVKIETKENSVRGTDKTEVKENSSLEENELVKIQWRTEKTDSDGNSKLSYLNFKMGYLSTPLPFDMIFTMNNIFNFFNGDEYKSNLYKEKNDYISDIKMIDYSFKISGFKNKDGTETACFGMDSTFSNIADHGKIYTLSPSFGVYCTGEDIFRGLYIFVNPAIFIFSENPDKFKSDWDWQFSTEIGGSVPFLNLIFSGFSRILVGYKAKSANEKSDIDAVLTLGMNFGAYLPSKKHSMFYKK